MVTLSTSGSSIIFTFQDNAHYLQNGVIETPKNSLTLVTDESNMATFKKIDGDIFISALYSELGMSKSELETWFKENAVGSTGGGTDTGTVQTMIDESISGKADSVSAVSSAEYDSSATTINFKNIDGDIISSIDASDFVIDGMIDNVSIETISGESYLVIDFNTASGKEDIQIPISDIFDADNYYTKAEVDAIASGKVDTSAYTPTVVDSTLDSGSTNPVQNQALYDELIVNPITSITWINSYSTNFPSGCTKMQVELDDLLFNGEYSDGSLRFYSSNTYVGRYKFTIDNNQLSVLNDLSSGSTYEVSGHTITITLPSSLNIDKLERTYDYYYATAIGDIQHLKDVVSGKQDKLTAGNGIYLYNNLIDIKAPIVPGAGTASIVANNASAATGIYSFAEGSETLASGNYSHAEGRSTIAGGSDSHAEGFSTSATSSYSHAEGQLSKASGNTSHAEGQGTQANGTRSHAEGQGTQANGARSHAEGYYTIANNPSEHASGQHNVSSSASTKFGDSGNTLFSVGNGSSSSRHNAFEIRQNGDIYITSGNTDILLQDHLGGGGSCTSSGGVIYDSFSQNYNDYNGDYKASFCLFDYKGDKTQSNFVQYYFLIGGENGDIFSTYMNCDYTEGTCTFNDMSAEDYVESRYDSTVQDFYLTIKSAYASTNWLKSIGNIPYGSYVKIPVYVIESGDSCSVIEDVIGAVDAVEGNVIKCLKESRLNLANNRFMLQSYTKGGQYSESFVIFDDLKGEDGKIRTNINVGLGTSGYTNYTLSQQGLCNLSDLKWNQYRITYTYSEFEPNYMNLTLSIMYNGGYYYDSVQFDSSTELPTLYSESFSQTASINWDATTKELVITYPSGATIYDITQNQCRFGYEITKVEYYAEYEQAIRPYVQETRAALGGLKLQQITQSAYDALVSGGTVDNSTIYYIVN